MTPTDPEHPTPNALKRHWALTASVLLCGFVVIAAYVSLRIYHYGKKRGAMEERERAFSREGAIQAPPLPVINESDPVAVEPIEDEPEPIEVVPEPQPDAAPEAVSSINKTWCFGPAECARLVWPMEIVDADAVTDHQHFRIRQGANLHAPPGKGLCEFVFRTVRPCRVAIWLRMKHSDDCGNAVNVSVDGSRHTVVGNTKRHGIWLWERARRQFSCQEGLHRLTISTHEDGLLFDKIIIVPTQSLKPQIMQTSYLNEFPFTPPPAFKSLPAADEHLPELRAVTVDACASDSMVFGAGHKNTLRVRVRLNGEKAVSGSVDAACAASGMYERGAFRLTPQKRTAVFNWKVERAESSSYSQVVYIVVHSGGRIIARQQVRFIRPLSWAFIGPFPDPLKQGLSLQTPADGRIADLRWLPTIPGYKWKIVEDGSCYDAFGIVDLNKVYGLPNQLWHYKVKPKVKPMVAYAVTCLRAFGNDRHNMLEFGGDDMIQVWQNGRELLKYTTDIPIETQNHIAGVNMKKGYSFFVFKIPQSGYYWQLMFRPHRGSPYACREHFFGMPVGVWNLRR